MLLIVMHLRHDSLIIRSINGLILLFCVRIAHTLLRLSGLGGGSLWLGLGLMELTEVEEGDVYLVSGWH